MILKPKAKALDSKIMPKAKALDSKITYLGLEDIL